MLLATICSLLATAAPVLEEEAPSPKFKLEPQEEIVLNSDAIQEIVFDDGVEDFEEDE